MTPSKATFAKTATNITDQFDDGRSIPRDPETVHAFGTIEGLADRSTRWV